MKLEKIGYLTATEAADYMMVSRQTLHRWVREGLIDKPVIQEGGVTIWRLSSIKKAMKKMGRIK